MKRISCGWCRHVIEDGHVCASCGRDPYTPWRQRGEEPPVVDEGRPQLSASDIARRYEAARTALIQGGKEPTVEAIAEILDRSPRTIREWRNRFGLR